MGAGRAWRTRWLLVILTKGILGLPNNLGFLLGDDLLALGEFLPAVNIWGRVLKSKESHLVQIRDLFHSPDALIVNRPATEKLGTFLLDFGVRKRCGAAKA